MVGISDTSPEAERVLREVYRRMPLARKWLLLGEMYQDGRACTRPGSGCATPPQRRMRSVNTGWPSRAAFRRPHRPWSGIRSDPCKI